MKVEAGVFHCIQAVTVTSFSRFIAASLVCFSLKHLNTDKSNKTEMAEFFGAMTAEQNSNVIKKNALVRHFLLFYIVIESFCFIKC